MFSPRLSKPVLRIIWIVYVHTYIHTHTFQSIHDTPPYGYETYIDCIMKTVIVALVWAVLPPWKYPYLQNIIIRSHIDVCVPVCQEFKYSVVVDIGHWHLEPFVNSNLHFLNTVEFHDLHCCPVAHIDGSLMVWGLDCKVDGPEVAGRWSLSLKSTRLSSNCPYHLLTCSDMVPAVSGDEVHWVKHIVPIKTEPLCEQLCCTKFSVTAFVHQLFLWIAFDWLLCHLLHVTATTSAASTKK